MIAMNNWKTGYFLYEIIPLIPFNIIIYMYGYERIFYLIKLMRLYTGFQLLDITTIMNNVKYRYKMKVERMIQKDQDIGEDKIKDLNGIHNLLIFNYFIKLSKLFFVIFSLCYFVGFFWYIFCEILLDLYLYFVIGEGHYLHQI
jgi:hypothetical protein